MLTIYMGYDPNEIRAYKVAEYSCLKHSSQPVRVIPLNKQFLYQWRMLWRPVESEGGRMIDHLSGAPQATEFASSRFLVPALHKTGWALFIDCDMVFTGDVAELFAYADPKYAAMCVKHDYTPSTDVKMCGHAQTNYSRKNWSSVILWNCDHPSNNRLTVDMVNSWPGILLHRFAWLRDEEIGELPKEWNWLIGEQEKPDNLKLAHFTLGGPWFKDWTKKEHDELWWKYDSETPE